MEVEILELESSIADSRAMALDSPFDMTRELDSIHGGVIHSPLTLETV